MLLALLMAASAAAAIPDQLSEASHAIDAGRLDQAKAMIAAAVARGASGDSIDRLGADLAYADGRTAEALARYKALLVRDADDPHLLERAIICAINLNALAEARSFAGRATAQPNASWRSWNARGVIADMDGDFALADSAYRRAVTLAPDQPAILNNLGWSLLLRGEWQAAIEPLRRASELWPSAKRTSNNLELAQSALAADLPRRRSGESDDAWAARLNDAGVAAELRGERARAVAAFAQAVEARETWYGRAANNLQALGGRK